MTASFWVFLFVCIISFIPVIRDHGKAWNTFRRTKGEARLYGAMQVVVLWAIPTLSFVGTVLFGFEASRSEESRAQDEPRTFSDVQKHNAPAFLGHFQGTPFALVSFADPDSARFGEELLDLLKSNNWAVAGWVTGGNITNLRPDGFEETREPVGVVLEAYDEKQIEPALADSQPKNRDTRGRGLTFFTGSSTP